MFFVQWVLESLIHNWVEPKSQSFNVFDKTGISPLNWGLPETRKTWIFFKEWKDLGIEPFKSLLLKLMCWRFITWPNEEGIEPSNLFPDKSINCNVEIANSSGIVPEILFPWAYKNCKLEISWTDDGIFPENRQLFIFLLKNNL